MKKFTAALLMMLSFITAGAGELTIYGDFPEPVKPGGPPKNWNLTSGARGSLEFVSTEDGNAVMLSADEKKSFGIYSRPAAVKAGDKIKVTAMVRGEKIEFSLFQYSGKFSNPSLRKMLKSTIEGKKLETVFTVTDSPRGKTDRIRVCFTVKNGSAASIINVKAFLLEQ
jgi:hypothetical protein